MSIRKKNTSRKKANFTKRRYKNKIGKRQQRRTKQNRRKTRTTTIKRTFHKKRTREQTRRRTRGRRRGGTGNPKLINPVTLRPNSQNFLKKMCPDSNECFALGKYTAMTNAYFDDMHFKHAVDPITAVGEKSNNGFIRAVKHTKDGYSTQTLLKSAKEKESDNLMYEYLVGMFINKYNSVYPCFLQTYACYKYTDDAHYDTFSANKQTVADLNALEPLYSYHQKLDKLAIADMIAKSCQVNKHACISIQYFEKPTSLHALLAKNNFDDYFNNVELIQILLQIFIPLGTMESMFTHNDLHTNNVLIYTIPNNKYVTMNYTTPHGNVSFKTRYVCKIIDYGRCYFKDERMTSEKLREELCKNVECGQDCGVDVDKCIQGVDKNNQENYCGSDVGHKFATVHLHNYNMSAIINNPGKDLWLLQIIQSFYNSNSPIASTVKTLIDSVFATNNSVAEYGINYPAITTLIVPPKWTLNVNLFMQRAITCFNGLAHIIKTSQATELAGMKNHGTFTINASTGADYVFEIAPIRAD
jgi:hypothetical protein